MVREYMPKNPPAVETKTRQAKKKQNKPIRLSTKRAKPDLIEQDKYPLLKQPTFVQKDKFTGMLNPVFI